MACYTIKDLTFSYPEQERKSLDHISLTIEEGEFIVLCGKSGCGKTTLLRHLKTVLTPHGERSGEIRFYGRKLEAVDFRNQSAEIGFVLQNPDNQIVTDKVWHELAFGLESLGEETQTIRRRVAEMASYFGIQNWFMKNVSELSGGQKQLLNLAAIMAMQPSVLILDEPTSQLDPIAASDFLATIRKINRELGTTIVLTEHRLEEVFPAADRIVVMEKGEIIVDNRPQAVGEALKTSKNDMFVSMPSPVQIYAAVESDLPCPLTVRDGRNWLIQLLQNREVTEREIADDKILSTKDPVISMKEIWFRYEKDAPDILKGITVDIPKGKLFCIVGGNGTGKSTALKVVSGILRPYRGKVTLHGKDIRKYSDKELYRQNLGVLPQDPQSLFVKKTVGEDLMEMFSGWKLPQEEKLARVKEVAALVEVDDLMDMHPYDLSGGEQQRAALGKVLLMEPKVLLLDEPTKGLDSFFKLKLADILKKLTQRDVTVVLVSHDVEFCARHGDSCSMFFDGDIVSTETPNRFFSGNSFYTTAANRMSRHIFINAINNEDVIELCNRNLME